jgi:hypothetical protein
MTDKKRYDSTVARIAGNILSGLAPNIGRGDEQRTVEWAVRLARLVVAEVEKIEEPPAPCVTAPKPPTFDLTLDEVSVVYAALQHTAGAYDEAHIRLQDVVRRMGEWLE